MSHDIMALPVLNGTTTGEQPPRGAPALPMVPLFEVPPVRSVYAGRSTFTTTTATAISTATASAAQTSRYTADGLYGTVMIALFRLAMGLAAGWQSGAKVWKLVIIKLTHSHTTTTIGHT